MKKSQEKMKRRSKNFGSFFSNPRKTETVSNILTSKRITVNYYKHVKFQTKHSFFLFPDAPEVFDSKCYFRDCKKK